MKIGRLEVSLKVTRVNSKNSDYLLMSLKLLEANLLVITDLNTIQKKVNLAAR